MSGYPGTRWADVQPCGTPAAARRHQRRGEPPCPSCLQAEARRWDDRHDAVNAARRERYRQLRDAGMPRLEANRESKRRAA